ATFQAAWNNNAGREKSPLQSILDGFNPVTIAKYAADCFCFLAGRVNLDTLRMGAQCASSLGLSGVGLAWSLLTRTPPVPPEIPQVCWDLVYQLSLQGEAPPANAKLSEKVEWLLDNLDHPCLRAIPLAQVLVDQAVQYRDSFVKVIELVEQLWEKRQEYKEAITKFIEDRVQA